MQSVKDLGPVTLVAQWRVLGQPDDIARPGFDRAFMVGADAKPEDPFQHNDHFVIENRPLDRAAIEDGDAGTHAVADVGTDQPGNRRPSGRPAKGLKPDIPRPDMMGLSHRSSSRYKAFETIC